jgi:hypothetical protein
MLHGFAQPERLPEEQRLWNTCLQSTKESEPEDSAVPDLPM